MSHSFARLPRVSPTSGARAHARKCAAFPRFSRTQLAALPREIRTKQFYTSLLGSTCAVFEPWKGRDTEGCTGLFGPGGARLGGPDRSGCRSRRRCYHGTVIAHRGSPPSWLAPAAVPRRLNAGRLALTTSGPPRRPPPEPCVGGAIARLEIGSGRRMGKYTTTAVIRVLVLPLPT